MTGAAGRGGKPLHTHRATAIQDSHLFRLPWRAITGGDESPMHGRHEVSGGGPSSPDRVALATCAPNARLPVLLPSTKYQVKRPSSTGKCRACACNIIYVVTTSTIAIVLAATILSMEAKRFKMVAEQSYLNRILKEQVSPFRVWTNTQCIWGTCKLGGKALSSWKDPRVIPSRLALVRTEAKRPSPHPLLLQILDFFRVSNNSATRF